jgi:hypothetical protein
LLSPTYSAAGLSVGTANPYYVRFCPNGTTSVLAYAMSQSQHSFPMIGNNDGQQLVEMEQIQLHLLQVRWCWFDATYDALVNTLTSEGEEL